jgi:hypothetical protein
VDNIAEVIKKEFEIDYVNSVDKRSILDPDRFGYLSLHYICKLSRSRLSLTEYQMYADCLVEIQIRSILQHTWAEIEHDLGYKNKVSIPKPLQRRFFQLAGHLELADELFTQLKKQIREYETEVSNKVLTSPDSIYIDNASLLAFIDQSDMVTKIDYAISELTGCPIEGIPDLNELTNRLTFSGFETIDEIGLALSKFSDILPRFTAMFNKKADDEPTGRFNSGISLFYLAYLNVARTKNPDIVIGFLKSAIPSLEHDTYKNMATNLINNYIVVSG